MSVKKYYNNVVNLNTMKDGWAFIIKYKILCMIGSDKSWGLKEYCL